MNKKDVEGKYVAVVYTGGHAYDLTKSFKTANAAEKACLKELGKNKGSYTISKIVIEGNKLGHMPLMRGKN